MMLQGLVKNYNHKVVKHYNYAVIMIDYKLHNCKWKQPRSRFTIETDMGSMSVISCAVELRRKPKYYVMHLIMPAVTMSTVSIFVFALPVESGEKISLGISVLISYSVITLLVADNMPTNGDTIPVLCRYPAYVISFSFIYLLTQRAENWHFANLTAWWQHTFWSKHSRMLQYLFINLYVNNVYRNKIWMLDEL